MKKTRDFYEADVWGEYHDLLVGKIPQDMVVYGEIVGYLTDSDKMIQKDYDYGCEAWKLKTDAFFSREQKLIDAGEVDMELMTTV